MATVTATIATTRFMGSVMIGAIEADMIGTGSATGGTMTGAEIAENDQALKCCAIRALAKAYPRGRGLSAPRFLAGRCLERWIDDRVHAEVHTMLTE
jgi:hypothetical protein